MFNLGHLVEEVARARAGEREQCERAGFVGAVRYESEAAVRGNAPIDAGASGVVDGNE